MTVIDSAPGFEMEDMRITRDVRRRPLDTVALRREYAAQMERANNYGRVSREIVDEVYRLVSHNAQLLDTYLRDFPGDYRCLVRLRACRAGIEVCKSVSGIEIAVVDPTTLSPLPTTSRIRPEHTTCAQVSPQSSATRSSGSDRAECSATRGARTSNVRFTVS